MKILVNAWGGDGYLSSSLLFMIACMGMLQHQPENNEEVILRVFELLDAPQDERLSKIEKAYRKYYPILFESDPELKLKPITLNTIVADFHTETQSEDYLFLGCTEPEIRLLTKECREEDLHLLRKSIYGKIGLGEVFYADTNFEVLYQNAFNKEKQVLTINCGSYSGDGVASVFIPKESAYTSPNGTIRRYHVISGLAVTSSEKIVLPYPDIYQKELKSQACISNVSKMFDELNTLRYDPKDAGKNKKNREYLNYLLCCKGLNFLTERFFDSLSMTPSVCATFINLSTDGKKLLPPDVISEEFASESQKNLRHFHVIHLVNALSIREILYRNQNYQNGKVYTFGTSAGDIFQPRTLFDKESEALFWRFLVCALMVKYSTFHIWECSGIVTEVNTPKEKKGLWGSVKGYLNPHSDTKSNQSQENQFVELVKNYLVKFMEDYVKVVLNMCIDIQNYSSRTCLFPKEIDGALRYLLNSEEAVFSSIIVEVLQQYYHKNITETRERAEAFIKEYLESFPCFSGYPKNSDNADRYSQQILLYAKKKAEYLIR